MDASKPKRVECLPGTRTDLISAITEWVHDRNTHNVLWIHGLAGTGKSTLLTSVATIFRDKGSLGAFLFFDRYVTEKSDPSTVIRTLAHQLSHLQPQTAFAIAASLDRVSSASFPSLEFQFQHFLVDALSTEGVVDRDSTIVFVLDALDECGTPGGTPGVERDHLLNVLAEYSALLLPNFRFIISSRTEADVLDAFDSQPHILGMELDVNLDVSSRDILTYLRHHMGLIRRKTKSLSTDWPGEDKIQQLTRCANGLFVWAATACEFINGHDPRKRLDLILQGNSFSAGHSLDKLYQTALNDAGMWDDGDFVEDFRAIMGMVLVLKNPLSSSAIDTLRGIPEHPSRAADDTIKRLSCLVSSNLTIRIIHPSFADFLMERARCGRDVWFLNPSFHHRAVSELCLRCLTHALRRNMCNLTLSVDVEDETLPEGVTYACLFWVDHILFSESDIAPLVECFLRQHLLHWFEAMSVIKKSRDTIRLLQGLSAWIVGNCPDQKNLLGLVQHAVRFAQNFASPIEEHPLLVYSTALPLASVSSSVYRQWHDTSLDPSIVGFRHSYSPLLLISASQHRGVNSVAFSPDGRRIVSCGGDQALHIWDAVLGSEVIPRLLGHEGKVCSIAFSPDGTRIVSGGVDQTIRMWDALSGVPFLAALQGHNDEVKSVTFSPDGTQILSGSKDRTIRIWDAIAGGKLLSVLHGHSDAVWSVAFSPDGRRIVSGSADKTIRIWNATSCAQAALTLRGHWNCVCSVVFSPDGNRIVSGSKDKTIRIWDAMSGAELIQGPLLGHGDWVHSVSFSLDGSRIVSGSGDCTVRVWDVITGASLVTPMQGHTDSVSSVAFSPDGNHIISGSEDGTVNLWDAISAPRLLLQPPGRTHEISSIAFSPEGSRIISGSRDGIIRVRDATSGVELLPVLRGHQRGVNAVTYSPSGAHIASGSHDRTIRIWNVISGDELLVMRGHERGVISVAFSPDETCIVSGSLDRTIGIWDATSGARLHALNTHMKFVRSVTFSPDGNLIVSSGGTGSDVRVWHTASGQQVTMDYVPDNSADVPLRMIQHNWIMHNATGRVISKVANIIPYTCSTAYNMSLAIGTHDGQVIIIHFPMHVFNSPETRPVDGGTARY